MVDKPQACRTENARFVALVSLFEQFEGRINQFFTDIYRLVLLTARDLAIFVLTTTTTITMTTTNRLLYPLHMRMG